MTKPFHQEVIDLCEDPREALDDVQSNPATAESLEQIVRLSDSLFLQASLEEQVWDVRHLSPSISARRLSQMPEQERTAILSELPTGLAEELRSYLPIGVS